MNLNHLKFVLAIARTGSFTKAADICFVTQPTLSNALKGLEDVFGDKIFERTTRQVRLTPFGRHILPAIQRIVDAEDECKTIARQFFEPELELLSIGFSPLADMRLINALIDPFIGRSNELKTYFKECYMEALENRLEEGEVDIVICPQVVSGQADPSKFKSSYFYSEPVYIVLRDEHQATSYESGPLSINDLSDETFVLTPEGCGHAPTTRNWFAQRGVALKEYPGQAMSYDVMQEWTSLGLASAILPWSKIKSENRSTARQLFIDQNTPADFHFEILWNRSRTNIQPLNRFLEFYASHGNAIISGLHLKNEKFRCS